MYKNYKNILCSLIKEAKSKYYLGLLGNDKGNKKTWNEINSILGNKKSKEQYINEISINNTILQSDVEIANAFNNHFATVGEKMSNELNYNIDEFHKYMPNKLNKSLLLKRVTENEIENIVSQLSSKKSSGIDKISQCIVKRLKNVFTPCIAYLINCSIDERIYPTRLKLSKITPILKGGDKMDINNYRPISLLSTFNKIFEKKIHSDISNFIECNHILFTNQFGFRKFHSTIDAVINTHDHIINERRNKNKIIGIFIDLKKAFDSIDNTILINKLNYYGIVGPYNKLLESYLFGRKCVTSINNRVSSEKEIKFGIPQGSVLGPLLFTLYINDLKFLAENNEINLFADDTCIFTSAKDYNELKTKCNELLITTQDWLRSNSLTLNVKKTHFVDFSTNKVRQEPFSIKIGDIAIEEATITKYLGMTLQNDLKWDKHIQNIIKAINSKIPLLYQLRNIIPNSKKIVIFNSLIMPTIIYGIEIYAKNSNSWTKLLQKNQNRLLKIFLHMETRMNTNFLHRSNKVLKIADLNKLRTILIAHKVIFYPEEKNISHSEIALAQNDNYNVQLRNRNNLRVTANSYRKHNKIIENAAIAWNDIPNTLKEVRKRKEIKLALKDYFIANYN